MTKIDYELDAGPDRRIRGTLDLPPAEHWPAPVVVFCHGFKGFKDWGGWQWFSGELAAAGFLVNRFNFSLSGVGAALDRHDEPEKFARNTYGHEIDDLRRVLEERSAWGIPDGAAAERVGVIGHSRGGFVALLTASVDPRIEAVVTLGSPGSGERFPPEAVEAWKARGFHEVVNARTGEALRMDRSIIDDYEAQRERYDVARAVAGRDVPTLVVHGDADEAVPVHEADWILEAMSHDQGERVIVEGAGHTFGLAHPFAGAPDGARLVLEKTTSWLQKRLRSGGVGG